MYDASFRAHGPGVLRQWTHQVESTRHLLRSWKRSRSQALNQAALPRTRRARSQSDCSGIPAFEHGAALLDLGQMEAQQLTDRRVWYSPVDDCLQKSKAIVGFEHLGRHHAVALHALIQIAPSALRR